MSGSPSEAEIRTQLQNAVGVLEQTRTFIDGTAALAGGPLDVLEQSVEGDYTPEGLAAAATRYRERYSDLLSPAVAREFLVPVLFEYARIIGYGSGYRDIGAVMRALYEYFDANTFTIKNRVITFDTTATLGAGNVGNGSMSRLTVDENGYDLEFCHVNEKKRFRCRQDQNNQGINRKHAEIFEHIGEAASRDNVLRYAFGSGERFNQRLWSKHAGTGAGGSLLRNSSFTDFDSSLDPKFEGWAQTFAGAATAADIDQATGASNVFRGSPGTDSADDASLKLSMDSASDTITLKQTIDLLQVPQLDPNTPYFLRVMWNREIGTGTAGTINLRMGASSASVSVAAQTGWQELLIGPGTANWFRNFNQDPFDIELEWTGGTAGYLLFDDMIFAPWDLIDGTYWCLRGGSTPWLVDDTLEFNDTGGNPATTGTIQWWLFVAGLGYLPSSATPTIADP